GAGMLPLLWAAGCSNAATQLVVAVDSDLSVPTEVTSIRAVRKSGDGTVRSDHVFTLSEVPLPFSFGVAPDDAAVEAAVIIEAHAIAPGGADVVVRRAETHFIEKKTLLLPLFLARACAT